MSRLIDVDKLIKRFEVLRDEHETHSISYNALYEILVKEPTAFDTEKVIEQLEQYANGKICNMHRNCPHKDNDNIACENCGALGAIDIVKKGGVE